MSTRRHCACIFEAINGPPIQYCSHHAGVRDEIERLIRIEEKYTNLCEVLNELTAENKRLKSQLDEFVYAEDNPKYVSEDQQKIRRLEGALRSIRYEPRPVKSKHMAWNRYADNVRAITGEVLDSKEQIKEKECKGCIGFSEEHTCKGWSDFQRMLDSKEQNGR